MKFLHLIQRVFGLIKDPDFKQWLADLKARIRQSQIKAMIKVNDEMLHLYWDLTHRQLPNISNHTKKCTMRMKNADTLWTRAAKEKRQIFYSK